MTTLATIEWPCTAEVPDATRVAPITPPISACEDEDGRPTLQVTMFQMIAPSRPANTIGRVIAVEATMPLAMVAATLMDRNAPARFSTADSATAAFGFSAPVAIDVAMALAVSWKPLVKSKVSAAVMTMNNRAASCTGVTIHDHPWFGKRSPGFNIRAPDLW